MDNRKLSDEEIEVIVKKVASQLKEDLYIGAGQGLIALAWKGVLIVLIVLAAYGLNGKIF